MHGLWLMVYNIFQTETATLQKIGVNNFGNETVLSTQTVKIDPVFGWKQMYNKDGQQFQGLKSIISDVDFDIEHDVWRLTYKGRNYRVEEMLPMYSIGGNVLEHIEIVFR